MQETTTTPLSLKFSAILFIVISICGICYLGKDILSPIFLSILFAILLKPVVLFLANRVRLPNALSVLLAVLLFIAFVGAIIFFISTQIAGMADDWGQIQQNLSSHYFKLQNYVLEHFGLSKVEQDKMIEKAKSDSMQSGKQLMSSVITSLSGTLLNVVLIPIYMFLLLTYRDHFKNFFFKLIDKKSHAKLKEILVTIQHSVQSYVLGLMLEMLIVSSLTSVGLMIIGVKYAILLGVLTGVLNLIPYIGITIAGLLTLFVSLTGASDLNVVSGILIVNVVVQFLDNNILVPLVVSSKVEINPLSSIIGIIIGGAIGGAAGMFLAIPVMAILKVIFDRVPDLAPWGFLLGDSGEKKAHEEGLFQRIKTKLFGSKAKVKAAQK